MLGAFCSVGWHTGAHEYESKTYQRTARATATRLRHRNRGGDHWVLEDVEPVNDHFGNEVTAEGEVVGLDRLRVDWLGAV